MNRFARQNRTGTTPVGAVVEGDLAIFDWRADLRARLDDQISRATAVTLAAAKSWVRLQDSPPEDVYLAEALRNDGLWGSELEPGTHIARWSDDGRTVTLRAWDWDLTRPLSSGGYEPMARVRTVPWPTKWDQARGIAAEDDFGVSEGDRAPAPQLVVPPQSPEYESEDALSVLDEDHGSLHPQSHRTRARLQENRAFQMLVIGLMGGAAPLLVMFALYGTSISLGLRAAIHSAALCGILTWAKRRGWLWRRARTARTPTVGDSLTRSQRILHVTWRFLVAVLVSIIALVIVIGTGAAPADAAPPGYSLFCALMVVLITVWWYDGFANRPLNPDSPESH